MSHKRKRKSDAVKLNMAAMLDMAFQLLAFFIFTFKPDPRESQISLRLPPPEAVAVVKDGQAAGADNENSNPIAGVESLIISVFATPGGDIDSMAVGEGPVGDTRSLEARLKLILSDPDVPFKQVIIQVGSQLRYSELMKVIDVCTGQKLPTGEPLTRLSFVELPDEPATGG